MRKVNVRGAVVREAAVRETNLKVNMAKDLKPSRQR